MGSAVLLAAEHTLVPTRRDHGFCDVVCPLGCLVVSEVGGLPLAWRHSLALGGKSHNFTEENVITIGFLVDHLVTIPTLTQWFRGQWPGYYADMSQEEMEQDFLDGASRDRLPIRLVAFESSELAGTIILRENGTEMPPRFQPELGGLYVVPSYRGHGIATELVRAGMNVARVQGYETVFATTVVAAGILERVGWEFVQTVIHQDGELSLYRCKL